MPPLALPPGTHPPRVLVVEPDDDVRHLLVTALTVEGCTVVDVATGEGANRALRTFYPTVAVVELRLAGQVDNGMTLLRTLRDHDADLPTVVCTGVPLTDQRRADVTAAAGAPPVLVTKPFEHPDLVGAVTAAHKRYVEAAYPAGGVSAGGAGAPG